jgi:hypothetical protein
MMPWHFAAIVHGVRIAVMQNGMLTPTMSGAGFQKLCYGLLDFAGKLLV